MRRRGAGGLLALVLAATVALVPTPAASAAEPAVPVDGAGAVTVSGGGWGHGRGMSQWGAQGAALRGLSHQQVLGFYYPGDTYGTRAFGQIRVRTATASSSVVATADGLTVTDQASGRQLTWGTRGSRLRVIREGSGLRLQQLVSGSWNDVTAGTWPTTPVAGPIRLRATGMLGTVSGTTTTRYRGELWLHARSSSVDTVNRLPIEQYLYSVVPAESPPYFELGALRAQAVAARSYAQFNCSAGATHFDVLATTACQVYRGHSSVTGTSTTAFEHARTTQAVNETKDRVMLRNGSPVRTEFSSSNGGVTAPSGPWPAKQDPYDGVDSRNTNHSWTQKLSAGTLRSTFSGVGEITAVQVQERDASGRVLRISGIGTSGTKTVTGDAARWGLGLKSTLFSPVRTVAGHVLTYDPAGGGQRVLELSPTGVATTLSSTTWPSGRDVVVPIEIDGSHGDEVLVYDSVAGLRAIYDVRADGTMRQLSSGGWSKGWDVIVPVEIDGTVGDELLVYNSVAGRRWLLDVSRSGGLSALHGGGWSKGWDVVVPVDVDADPSSELVTYNSTTGRRWLLDLRASGSTAAISGGRWSTGWDSVDPVAVPGSRAENLHFLNSSTGRRLVVRVSPSGGLAQLSSEAVGSGWTEVVPLELDGSAGSEVVLYRAGDGTAEVGDIRSSGSVVTTGTRSWPPGQQVVVPLTLPRR